MDSEDFRSQNMKRVGIYSGTFDPIHDGHLAFAREALKQCKLDKIFFMVEPRPRRKQGVKAFEHRTEMVRLAIKSEPEFGSIVLEQQRFTPAETLPVLQERFKGAELYMLMGDDWLAHFAGEDWPQVEIIVEQLRFAIGIRKHSRTEVEKRLKVIQRTRGLDMRYELFQAPEPAVSSSEIKRQLKEGVTPLGLKPEVMDYIVEHGIYSVAANS